MDVRPVRPTDAPLVLALALDDGAQIVTGPAYGHRAPLGKLIAHAAFPLALPGRSWLVRDGASAGVVEAQPRQYVIGWDVVRLAVHGEADRVLGPLLGAVTQHLQSRGVPRLFARCLADRRDALASHDFLTLAREYVLIGPEGPPPVDSRLHIDSRYRMPQDAWPLHQLESETTPALVRQLEGLTSSDWSHKSRNMSEIVVERQGKIVAWIGWSSRPTHGILPLGMLVHPDYRALGPDLLLHALAHGSANSRFAARVREYHVETLRTLLDAGFTILREEALMVKHAGVEVVQEARHPLLRASLSTIQGVNSQLGVIVRARPAYVED